jgi:hypothetical protein
MSNDRPVTHPISAARGQLHRAYGRDNQPAARDLGLQQ